MISNLFGRFLNPEINEKNILKQIHDCLEFWFSGKSKSDYIGVMGLTKRPDLKSEFAEHAEQLGINIARNANPHYALREAIISNARVVSTYSPLISSEFDSDIENICNAINKGWPDLKNMLASNPHFEMLSNNILAQERFTMEWSRGKVTHEAVWADAEYIVLRHLQAMMFEKVGYDDWSSILKKAYEDYIKDYYRLILKTPDKDAWFHPTIVASVNDQFVEMEQKILAASLPSK